VKRRRQQVFVHLPRGRDDDCIWGGEPTVADSPTPLAPIGWWGEGVTVSASPKCGFISDQALTAGQHLALIAKSI
jgi:hypothetical protein